MNSLSRCFSSQKLLLWIILIESFSCSILDYPWINASYLKTMICYFYVLIVGSNPWFQSWDKPLQAREYLPQTISIFGFFERLFRFWRLTTSVIGMRYRRLTEPFFVTNSDCFGIWYYRFSLYTRHDRQQSVQILFYFNNNSINPSISVNFDGLIIRSTYSYPLLVRFETGLRPLRPETNYMWSSIVV